MKFIDISLPLRRGMVVWAGDTPFSREEAKGTAIVSKINMSSHTGTHIDAPKHFIFNAGTVDEIFPQKLIGTAKVIAVNSKKLIEPADFRKVKISRGDKILFKTRNAALTLKKSFTSDYVSLSLGSAKFLARKGIDLVGIDYLGIEAKGSPGHPVHKTLLRDGIVIVEGLDLRKAKPGRYNLVVLPLKLVDGDGSPARAILWS